MANEFKFEIDSNTSNEIEVPHNLHAVAVLFPTGWDGGNLTFQTKHTKDGDWVDVNVATVTAEAEKVVGIVGDNLQILSALTWVRVVSASNVLTAAKTIKVFARTF